MSNKTYLTVLGSTIGVTLLAGIIQMMPGAKASEPDQAASATASVTVTASCSLVGHLDREHSAVIPNGLSESGIGQTTLTASCNDGNGFSIYAVGYGQDTVGTNVLHSNTLSTAYDIPSDTTKDSNWTMQMGGGTNISIVNNFDQPHVVPNAYAKVAQYGSATEVSTMTTTYNASISTTQPAGTYVGQVKYLLVHPSGGSISDDLEMQNVDVWKSTMLEGETYKAVDTRDDKEYYVAKLCMAKDANGQCTDTDIWMTQNLDLCIGCTGMDPLTSNDTDLHTAGTGIYTNGYTTDSSGVITWTPSGSTMQGTPAEITNFAPGSPANSVTGWTNNNTQPYMAEGGSHWVANNTPYSVYSTCVGANGAVACDHGQVGNYYNWTASIASNDSTALSAKFGDADNSICPRGWRLPDGPDGTNGSEFNTMLSAADIANGVDNGSGSSVNVGFKNDGRAKMENTPYYFIRSGNVGGTTFYYLTASGGYWSRSAVSGSYAFGLYYSGTELYPAYQGVRYDGRSVRCVAR